MNTQFSTNNESIVISKFLNDKLMRLGNTANTYLNTAVLNRDITSADSYEEIENEIVDTVTDFAKGFSEEYMKKLTDKNMSVMTECVGLFFNKVKEVENKLSKKTVKRIEVQRKVINYKIAKYHTYKAGLTYASAYSEDNLTVIYEMVKSVVAPRYHNLEKRHNYIQLTPEYRWDINQASLDKVCQYLTIIIANIAVLDRNKKNGEVWIDTAWLREVTSKKFLYNAITDNDMNPVNPQVFADNHIHNNKNTLLTALKLLGFIDAVTKHNKGKAPRSVTLESTWRAKLRVLYESQVTEEVTAGFNKQDSLGTEVVSRGEAMDVFADTDKINKRVQKKLSVTPRIVPRTDYIKLGGNTVINIKEEVVPAIVNTTYEKERKEESELAVTSLDTESLQKYFNTRGYIPNTEFYNRNLQIYQYNKLNTNTVSAAYEYSKSKYNIPQNMDNEDIASKLNILQNIKSDSQLDNYLNDSLTAANQIQMNDNKYIISRTGRIFQSGGGFQNLKGKFKKLVAENTKIAGKKLVNIDISDCHVVIILNILQDIAKLFESEVTNTDYYNRHHKWAWYNIQKVRDIFPHLKKYNPEQELADVNNAINIISDYLDKGKQYYADSIGISKDTMKSLVYASVCGSNSVYTVGELKSGKTFATTEIDKIMKKEIMSGKDIYEWFYNNEARKLFQAFKLFRKYIPGYTINVISPKEGDRLNIHRSMIAAMPDYQNSFSRFDAKNLPAIRGNKERRAIIDQAREELHIHLRTSLITNGVVTYCRESYDKLSAAQKAAFVLQGTEVKLIDELAQYILGKYEDSEIISNEHDGLLIAVKESTNEELMLENIIKTANKKLADILYTQPARSRRELDTPISVSIKAFENKDNDDKLLSETQEWIRVNKAAEEYTDIPRSAIPPKTYNYNWRKNKEPAKPTKEEIEKLKEGARRGDSLDELFLIIHGIYNYD